MRYALAGVLVGLAVAHAGCSESSPPSAPSGSAPTGVVSVQIAPLPGNAGVVGIAVPLSATVLVDGGPPPGTAPSINWASSNPAVARVDERGVLTGVTPGETVITATARNATGTLAVEVVLAFSGTIPITWIAVDCAQHNAACAGPVPSLRSAVVTVTQTGGQIEATWGTLSWMTGHVPFSGRIHADGSIDLSGTRCSVDDIGRGTLFTLTDWRMQRGANGVYSGRVRLVQENDCSGRATSRLATDYIVELRP